MTFTSLVSTVSSGINCISFNISSTDLPSVGGVLSLIGSFSFLVLRTFFTGAFIDGALNITGASMLTEGGFYCLINFSIAFVGPKIFFPL